MYLIAYHSTLAFGIGLHCVKSDKRYMLQHLIFTKLFLCRFSGDPLPTLKHLNIIKTAKSILCPLLLANSTTVYHSHHLE